MICNCEFIYEQPAVGESSSSCIRSAAYSARCGWSSWAIGDPNIDGGSGTLIAITGGHVTPVGLADLLDSDTGRIRVRMVDVSTESYHVARSYMIRLEPRDLEEPSLSRIAACTKLRADDFKGRFQPTVTATALSLRTTQIKT